MSQDQPSCPKCGSNMFDNRETKQNPKAPDFKCKDRSCDGVIWPPRKQAPKKAPPAMRTYDSGPLLPGEEEGYGEALAGQQASSINTPGNHPSNSPPESQQEKVERMYLESLHFVVNKVVPVWEAGKVSYDAAAVNAAVAVVVIQRGGR